MRRRWWAGLLGLGAYGLGPYAAVQVGNWGLVREGNRKQRKIALTFDDGPDPLGTPNVLDALAAAGMHATFFVLPERAEAHPGLIRRMLEEGHQVEAHTEVHRHAWTRTPWGTFQDVRRAVQRVAAVTGQRVTLQRPAHGAYTLGTVLGQRAAGVTGAHWSIEGRDWNRRFTSAQVRERLNDLLIPGAVTVLHDAGPGAAATLEMLPDFLADLKARGYSSVTLGKLPGAAPQGKAELKRRLFTALDDVYDRLEGVRFAGNRRDNLFRIGPHAFPLTEMTLNDGTRVRRGAKAIEFHVNNSLLVDIGPRRGVRQAPQDFRAVVHEWRHHPSFQEAEVIYCLSALSPLLKLLKFETYDLPTTDARRLQGWANVLRRAYGTQNEAQTPRLSILSRERFMELFGDRL